MVLTPPDQFRSVDPYSENRWSSVINRISRITTGGEDTIYFPESSFLFTRTDTENIVISSGVCVKDDVMIHIHSSTTVDFTDDDNYLDDTPGMTEAAWYYVVMYYVYDRQYPAPKAYYRIIKDHTILTTYSANWIFLAAVNVISDGLTGFWIDPGENWKRYYDHLNPTITRPYLQWGGNTIDGGVLPDCLALS